MVFTSLFPRTERLRTVLLSFCMLSVCATFAQKITPPDNTNKSATPVKAEEPAAAERSDGPRPLVPNETITVRDLTGGLYSQTACDADGNIYVRVTAKDMLSDPFERYTAKGEKKAEFKLPATQDVDFIAFGPSVGADGSIYVPAAAYKKGMKFRDPYVLRYSKDGELKNSIHLDAPIDPRRVVAFKDGKLLVSGTQLPTDQDNSMSTAFLAIFDDSGKLVKRITVQEDEELKRKADIGDVTVTGSAGKGYNHAVDASTAVIGSDGNCYLARATSAPTVHVISPSGEILRSFRVDSGTPDLYAHWLHESNGYLAVMFTRSYVAGGGLPIRVLKVVNESTGEEVASYDPNGIIGGPLCFNYPSDFVFAAYKNHKLTFVSAQPR